MEFLTPDIHDYATERKAYLQKLIEGSKSPIGTYIEYLKKNLNFEEDLNLDDCFVILATTWNVAEIACKLQMIELNLGLDNCPNLSSFELTANENRILIDRRNNPLVSRVADIAIIYQRFLLLEKREGYLSKYMNVASSAYQSFMCMVYGQGEYPSYYHLQESAFAYENSELREKAMLLSKLELSEQFQQPTKKEKIDKI